MKAVLETKKMCYYLVKENNDYADEFDVNGFTLYKWAGDEDSLIKNIVDNFESEHGSKYPIERYFGTNECIIFDNRAQIEYSLRISKIAKSDYDSIEKCIGSSFGTTIIC